MEKPDLRGCAKIGAVYKNALYTEKKIDKFDTDMPFDSPFRK